MTKDISLLAEALIAFQSECPTIPLSKSVKVTTNGGGSYDFKYAELSHIIAITRPLLTKHKLAVSQTLETDGTVKTLLIHSSGQYISSTLRIMGLTTPQGIGSAITYARRYSYSSILGIVAEDDDDGNGSMGNKMTVGDKAKPEPAPPSPPVSPAPTITIQTGPSGPRQNRNELPWLDQTKKGTTEPTREWENVRQKIANKRIKTISEVERFYRINKETKNLILDLILAAQ